MRNDNWDDVIDAGNVDMAYNRFFDHFDSMWIRIPQKFLFIKIYLYSGKYIIYMLQELFSAQVEKYMVYT